MNRFWPPLALGVVVKLGTSLRDSVLRALGAFLILCVLIPQIARADLGAVCPEVLPWPRYYLYKYVASGHFPTYDIRRNSCSFIIGKGGTPPAADSLPVYDRFGVKLNTFKVYARGQNGLYAARFYTYGKGCRQMAEEALKRTRRSRAYIEVEKGKCLRVKRLVWRQGSVY